MEHSAVFDPTGVYRYQLVRAWDRGLPRVAFVMLNPSRADATRDDPTIRRCIGFACAWGYGSLEVVNLFAYRAVTPPELFRATAPVGPENDYYLARAAGCAAVVLAWGNHGARFGRAGTVLPLFAEPYCLGVTGNGQPRHPLYIAASAPLLPFAATACPNSGV